MSVALVALSFNHAGAPAAITIRRNARQAVAVPEWRATGGDAVACYALDRLVNGAITVQAQIARRAPELERVHVRAIPYEAPAPPFVWWPSSIVPALMWPAAASAQYWLALYAALASGPQSDGPATSPFGEIAPQEIVFPADGLAVQTFTVANSRLVSNGVNVYPVAWRWQFRRGPLDSWIDFALTGFTVYSVLSTPTRPWLQAPDNPANTQLPWVEVLDAACRWAAGTTTVDEAAARVTESVYALGSNGFLAYDCSGSDPASLGTPHYTLIPGFFNCSEFLARLHGGFGNGPFVNCSDCAAAVSTFANALGCELSQSRMFGSIPFPLNPTRSIGAATWASACSIGAFSMHEVAWTGGCGENDRVFDACLQIDADNDPTRAPQTPLLAVNMPFGAAGAGLYRDRLAAPAGRSICNPQPLFRQRRFIL